MLRPSSDLLVATRGWPSGAVTAMRPTNGRRRGTTSPAEMTGRARQLPLVVAEHPHEALNSANDLEKTPMVDILPGGPGRFAQPHRRGDHRACAGQSGGGRSEACHHLGGEPQPLGLGQPALQLHQLLAQLRQPAMFTARPQPEPSEVRSRAETSSATSRSAARRRLRRWVGLVRPAPPRSTSGTRTRRGVVRQGRAAPIPPISLSPFDRVPPPTRCDAGCAPLVLSS